PSLCCLPPHAFGGRARQHAVFGGYPALPQALEPRRHPFLEACRAQYVGVAEAHEARAFGMFGDTPLEGDFPQFMSLPPRWTHVGSLSWNGRVLASRLTAVDTLPRLGNHVRDAQTYARRPPPGPGPSRPALARDFPAPGRDLSRYRRAGRLAHHLAHSAEHIVAGLRPQRHDGPRGIGPHLFAAYERRAGADRYGPALLHRCALGGRLDFARGARPHRCPDGGRQPAPPHRGIAGRGKHASLRPL